MDLVETTNTDLSGKLSMTCLKAMLDLQYKQTEFNTSTMSGKLVRR